MEPEQVLNTMQTNHLLKSGCPRPPGPLSRYILSFIPPPQYSTGDYGVSSKSSRLKGRPVPSLAGADGVDPDLGRQIQSSTDTHGMGLSTVL